MEHEAENTKEEIEGMRGPEKLKILKSSRELEEAVIGGRHGEINDR